MLSQPAPGTIELLVLAGVDAGCTTIPALCRRVGQPDGTVRAAVGRLAQNGLVTMAGETVELTADGRHASAHARRLLPRLQPGMTLPSLDLGDVTRFVETVWSGTASARTASRRRTRNNLLASNADRDFAVQRLSDAFAEGRLSSSELEERTGRALTARTFGDLDAVLVGLGGMPTPPRSHPVRRAVFWVAAVLTAPFVLLGTLLLLFGAEGSDRVGGVFFLVLLLPGLVALGRWAWRRS